MLAGSARLKHAGATRLKQGSSIGHPDPSPSPRPRAGTATLAYAALMCAAEPRRLWTEGDWRDELRSWAARWQRRPGMAWSAPSLPRGVKDGTSAALALGMAWSAHALASPTLTLALALALTLALAVTLHVSPEPSPSPPPSP